MPLPLALQLYTLREQLAQDFVGTMESVAALGFVAVETAFFENISIESAARVIQDLGLEVAAMHCDPPLGDRQDAVLATAEAFNCARLVWHGWPKHSDYDSLEGIQRLAEGYNQANKVARANGYRFGLHNHWWECEQVEGHYPYRVLHAEMDDSIFIELDTYWAQTAGLNPVAIIDELGERVSLLHLKDGPAEHGEAMLAAGQGVMDFPAIIHSATAAEWLIVELDACDTDMLTAVEQSYRYFTERGLAEGRSLSS